MFYPDKITAMTCAPAAKLEIRLPERLLSLMRLVVARGICFDAPAGISVTGFLTRTLGLDADFIENRIQTIFLDGHAVDAPDDTRLQDGGTLALSAAMPGLFGAAFRKGGEYRAMRRSYEDNRYEPLDADTGRTVTVIVKCFNQVAEAIGDDLLSRGICMNVADFLGFWKSQRSLLEPALQEARIDGRPVAPERVAGLLNGKDGNLTVIVRSAASCPG